MDTPVAWSRSRCRERRLNKEHRQIKGSDSPNFYSNVEKITIETILLSNEAQNQNTESTQLKNINIALGSTTLLLD